MAVVNNANKFVRPMATNTVLPDAAHTGGIELAMQRETLALHSRCSGAAYQHIFTDVNLAPYATIVGSPAVGFYVGLASPSDQRCLYTIPWRRSEGFTRIVIRLSFICDFPVGLRFRVGDTAITSTPSAGNLKAQSNVVFHGTRPVNPTWHQVTGAHQNEAWCWINDVSGGEGSYRCLVPTVKIPENFTSILGSGGNVVVYLSEINIFETTGVNQ